MIQVETPPLTPAMYWYHRRYVVWLLPALLLLTLRAQSVDLQGMRLGDIPGLLRDLASPFLNARPRNFAGAVAFAAHKVMVMMVGRGHLLPFAAVPASTAEIDRSTTFLVSSS